MIGRWLGRLGIIALVVALGWLGWRGNAFDVRARPPFGSVAVAFDDPIGYPGYSWSRDGRRVGPEEVNTIAGPGHCGWQSATMLFIGWPLGTVSTTAAQARQYIRDPRGVLGHRYQELMARSVTLPSDAHPTGYRLGLIELYLSPSDQDQWIYVVSPSDRERWPRADPMVLCA